MRGVPPLPLITAHIVARVQHDAVEGTEVTAVGVQVVFDDREQFAGVAAQPGQVEHDEGVAAAHVIEGGGQAGSGGALGARCLVEVDPGAAGGLEGVDLAREFLGVGGHPGQPNDVLAGGRVVVEDDVIFDGGLSRIALRDPKVAKTVVAGLLLHAGFATGSRVVRRVTRLRAGTGAETIVIAPCWAAPVGHRR